MLIDYHVHLDKLEWSLSTIEEMCGVAQKSGIDKLGIVVHTQALDGFQPLYDHIIRKGSKHKKLKFNKNIQDYINLLNSAKDKGYPINTGIEVCYSPEGEDFLKNKLSQYSFDFLIGSVHLIGRRHYKTAVEKYKNRKVVGQMYYSLVLKAIESKLFDIVGHIEIIRREGIPGLDKYPELLDKICLSLIENNCAVEINTKWLTSHSNLIPDIGTLTYMGKKGVKLVFSSDAHHLTRIGFQKDIAYRHIVDAGFEGFGKL